jgi:2'-5' RNA ligase
VALDLPGAVLGELEAWQRANLRRTDLRGIATPMLHVTLCFLGAQPLERIEPLSAVVAERGAPEEELALGEPLWLPPRRPGVLAIGVEDPSGALTRLQADVAGALVDLGAYEPEDRPFLPHVTIARVRRGRRVHPEPLPAPAPVPFASPALVLYRSFTAPGGARYEALARA